LKKLTACIMSLLFALSVSFTVFAEEPPASPPVKKTAKAKKTSKNKKKSSKKSSKKHAKKSKSGKNKKSVKS
jgi:hypothetical protein